MENENSIVLQGEETPAPVIYDLFCTEPGCTVKTGEYTLPSNIPADFDISKITHADLGISDTKCDAHYVDPYPVIPVQNIKPRVDPDFDESKRDA